MRKNKNVCNVIGYVYDTSKLAIKVTGETSKNPGTEYINGDLMVAVDEDAMNVIPVHFTYVTAVYGKSGKPNSTFTNLKKIIASETGSWVAGGKETAIKVKIQCSITLNDFVDPSDDTKMISAKRLECSFLNFVNELPAESERNAFEVDMVLTNIVRVEADPEKNIKDDYAKVKGIAFNYRNELLPMELIIKNPAGINYLENLNLSAKEPLYTKVYGNINSFTVKYEKEEEVAFGEAIVTSYERKQKEWLIRTIARIAYDFGDEAILTVEDLKKGMQDREVYLAETRKRDEEWKASKTSTASTSAVLPNDFSF